MYLFGRRCIVTTRREARQILAATTAKSVFGTVRQARTSPSVGHPITADHGPFAPFSKRGEPVNSFNYLPIFGSKRPAAFD